MLQMASVGPMLGQTHHFVKFNPGKSPYAQERYSNENTRLYKVLNDRLKDREYICDEYSVVDIATWPWISRFEWQQMNLCLFEANAQIAEEYLFYLKVLFSPTILWRSLQQQQLKVRV